MRIALYQPDQPGNAGAVMRTAAALGVAVDLIGPLGFVLSDRRLKRAGMDYLERLELAEHSSWQAFEAARAGARGGASDPGGRLVLLSTQAETPYWEFTFLADDILLAGRESAGVPTAVMDAADAGVRVPLEAGARALNVAQSLAMVLGEALRQTGRFPEGGPT